MDPKDRIAMWEVELKRRVLRARSIERGNPIDVRGLKGPALNTPFQEHLELGEYIHVAAGAILELKIGDNATYTRAVFVEGGFGAKSFLFYQCVSTDSPKYPKSDFYRGYAGRFHAMPLEAQNVELLLYRFIPAEGAAYLKAA